MTTNPPAAGTQPAVPAIPWARQPAKPQEPTTSRSRRIAHGLPDWEPLPPGEILVERPRGWLNPELGAERPAWIEPAAAAEASGASQPAESQGWSSPERGAPPRAWTEPAAGDEAREAGQQAETRWL